MNMTLSKGQSNTKRFKSASFEGWQHLQTIYRIYGSHLNSLSVKTAALMYTLHTYFDIKKKDEVEHNVKYNTLT